MPAAGDLLPIDVTAYTANKRRALARRGMAAAFLAMPTVFQGPVRFGVTTDPVLRARELRKGDGDLAIRALLWLPGIQVARRVVADVMRIANVGGVAVGERTAQVTPQWGWTALQVRARALYPAASALTHDECLAWLRSLRCDRDDLEGRRQRRAVRARERPQDRRDVFGEG